MLSSGCFRFRCSGAHSEDNGVIEVNDITTVANISGWTCFLITLYHSQQERMTISRWEGTSCHPLVTWHVLSEMFQLWQATSSKMSLEPGWSIAANCWHPAGSSQEGEVSPRTYHTQNLQTALRTQYQFFNQAFMSISTFFVCLLK